MRGAISVREVKAGTMFGFQIINRFPDSCTEEEWTEFADSMSKIFDKKDVQNNGAYAATA
jgi:hypothetical protein